MIKNTQKSLFVAIMISTLLFSCKENPKKENAKAETSVPANNNEKISLDVFSQYPESMGCSCHMSINKEDFKKNQFIFIDNNGSLPKLEENFAYVSLNGKVTKFMMTTASSTSKSFTNGEFDLIINQKSITKTSDEIWHIESTLILKDKKGKTLFQKEIVGTCGC
ncbi:hypothetical protein [Chryseobacterium sp. MMS23-Vi53]|uniref:hypothetical protein n=1 Tax=Chryseobacterium sp. MMS23-Vi53 TaxID=3386644 RepID=UPI0039ECC7E7